MFKKNQKVTDIKRVGEAEVDKRISELEKKIRKVMRNGKAPRDVKVVKK